MLHRAEYLIEFGSPQSQLAIIRALIPPMLFTVKDTGEADRKRGEMRKELDKLMRTLLEEEQESE